MAYVSNASNSAYEFIGERIRSGEWGPGDRIWTEAKLCEHLGISRVAVRQAIDWLAAQSVVYKIQGSGTYVCEPSAQQLPGAGLIQEGEEDIMDILEFRRYFEVGNIMMFMKNHDEDDIRALEDTYAAMREAAERDDMAAFYTADYRFHDIIARGTKKKFVYHISSILTGILNRHQKNINARIGPDVGLEYHPYILEYIKKNDADLAAMFMQRHIDATIEAVRKAQAEAAESQRRLARKVEHNEEPAPAGNV